MKGESGGSDGVLDGQEHPGSRMPIGPPLPSPQLPLLQVGTGLFNGIVRKGPTHGRHWCGKIYSVEIEAASGSHLCLPPLEKNLTLFIEARTKASAHISISY